MNLTELLARIRQVIRGPRPGERAILSCGILRDGSGYYANLVCGHKVSIPSGRMGAWLRGDRDGLACAQCAHPADGEAL